jgi:hypothetical protein
MIGFENLRGRLIERIRLQIRNGDMTERALARRAGISQPHMHNLLKGVRALSPACCDELMSKLGLTVFDLVDTDELRRALFLAVRKTELSVEVPVLLDRLGPGLPWPDRVSPFERIAVPYAGVSQIAEPVVARLADDSAMNPTLAAGDLVLLDASQAGCNCADPDALFAIQHAGSSYLRWIRRGRSAVYLLTAECRNRPHAWDTLPAKAVIRGCAVPIASMHAAQTVYDPLLPPRDKRRELARRSSAS